MILVRILFLENTLEVNLKMENKNMQNTSFRGKAIPEFTLKKDY